MCVKKVHYDHNSKPFCDVLEQLQHFVKIMKSDLYVYFWRRDVKLFFKTALFKIKKKINYKINVRR